MLTVGFPISHKENEKRRAILPCDLKNFDFTEYIMIEKGYGEILNISDEEYIECGCKVGNRENVLAQNIICDPKIGDADYLSELKEGQIVFGWIHAVQNKNITDILIEKKITAFAWEDMFDLGKHIFSRNNELAGEAAIMHAFMCDEIMPYNTNVAVLGNGNTAKGAIKILTLLGANLTQYTKKTEKLFQREFEKYDVIVNCVLWDVLRKDHILYKKDLVKLKPGSMIIDVSCDRCGAIESSVPTTIENPTYIVDNVLHYVVDHTPSLFHKTFSKENSKIIIPFIKELITSEYDTILQNSMIISDGKIIDKKIIEYQNLTL